MGFTQRLLFVLSAGLLVTGSAGAQGDPCSDHVECQSGFCADGVCCESACDGSCDLTCNDGISPGVCQPVNCLVPENPCRWSFCNEDTGECQSAPVEDGTPCGDGDPCTTDDRCQTGLCTGGYDTCAEPGPGGCDCSAPAGRAGGSAWLLIGLGWIAFACLLGRRRHRYLKR